MSASEIRSITRRRFLGSIGAGAAALALPATLRGSAFRAARRVRALRIRGVVRSAGRGLGGVGVTDGVRVVETVRDGTFELLSRSDRPFAYLSLPRGHRVPTTAWGTAALHRPLPTDRDEAAMEFDLEPLEVDDDRHVMLLLADIQTQDADEMAWFHERTIPDVRATLGDIGERPVVGIACGDIMYDHLEFFDEYEQGVQRMGIPFFQVVGNHDVDMEAQTDEASVRTFARHFGPGHYSFDRGAVHYVVLDDIFWNGSGYWGYVGADQLAWLEADLLRVEPGRVVIVALHIPLLGTQHLRYGHDEPWASESVSNRDALLRLLEPYRAHVLSGHMHEQEHVVTGPVEEHVHGAVCGAWWSGPICADGTPNGYSIYKISGEEVRWRYKATEHSADHQMRLYPPGAEPELPGHLLANVWDWDEAWKVLLYVDGEPRGALEPRTGLDPWARALHTGPDEPPRRTWVEPYPTRHLLHAPLEVGATDVLVEATDRFGRTHTARMPASWDPTVVERGLPVTPAQERATAGMTAS